VKRLLAIALGIFVTVFALTLLVGSIFLLKERAGPSKEVRELRAKAERLEENLARALDELIARPEDRGAAQRTINLALETGHLGLALVVAHALGIRDSRLEEVVEFVRQGERRLAQGKPPERQKALSLIERFEDDPLADWIRFYVASRYAATGDWHSALNNFLLIRHLAGVEQSWVTYFALRAAIKANQKEKAEELYTRSGRVPVDAPLALKLRIRLMRIAYTAKFVDPVKARWQLRELAEQPPQELERMSALALDRLRAEVAREIARRLAEKDAEQYLPWEAELWLVSALEEPRATARDPDFVARLPKVAGRFVAQLDQLSGEELFSLARSLAMTGAGLPAPFKGSSVERAFVALSLKPEEGGERMKLAVASMQLSGDPEELVALVAAELAERLVGEGKELAVAEELMRTAAGLSTRGWPNYAYRAAVIRRLRGRSLLPKDAEMLVEAARAATDPEVVRGASAEALGYAARSKGGPSVAELLEKLPESEVTQAWRAQLRGKERTYTFGEVSFYQLTPELERFGWADQKPNWNRIKEALGEADRFAGWGLMDLARTSGSGLTAVGYAAAALIGAAGRLTLRERAELGELPTRPSLAYLTMLAWLYRSPYRELIDRLSRQAGVEPELVAAVALKESDFRADARSPAGAVGIMQVMPGVARNLPGIRSDQLEDPEVNIRAGIRVLMEAGLGQAPIEEVLAAYNWGRSRVGNHPLGPSEEGRRLVWIETLPIIETEYFVKKVITYRALYRLIWGIFPADSSE